MPGYTRCYLQDWIEEKLDLIENVEPDRRAESDEIYLSEVDGVTEDEGEREFVPRALPVESPEERAERKSSYIHSILQTQGDTTDDEPEARSRELGSDFEKRERLRVATLMAKENLRVFNLKKEFSRWKMEDAKRKGPMWEARRRNRERQRLKHEAEKRRISRRKYRHARRYRNLQQTRKAIPRLRGKKQ
jgi:hypothetical protein